MEGSGRWYPAGVPPGSHWGLPPPGSQWVLPPPALQLSLAPPGSLWALAPPGSLCGLPPPGFALSVYQKKGHSLFLVFINHTHFKNHESCKLNVNIYYTQGRHP